MAIGAPGDLNKGKGPNDVVKCVPGKPLTPSILARSRPGCLHPAFPGALGSVPPRPPAPALTSTTLGPVEQVQGGPHRLAGGPGAVCWKTHRLPVPFSLGKPVAKK